MGIVGGCCVFAPVLTDAATVGITHCLEVVRSFDVVTARPTVRIGRPGVLVVGGILLSSSNHSRNQNIEYLLHDK